MTVIKAVIFDLDNTLYDYDKCNNIAERKLVELIASEFEISEETAKQLLKNAKLNIKKQLGEEVAASHNRLLYMQNICEQVGKKTLRYAMEFYNAYWDSMLEEMKLFDYVCPLVTELKEKGIIIGVLTDLTAHIQYRKLDRLGLLNLVDYLTTSEEAGAEKPSPKGFQLMISKLHLNPDSIVMIGDSFEKDICGAKRLGMKCILYKNGVSVREQVLKLLSEE